MESSEPSIAIDLSRPILSQVGAMGDAYDRWVHDPVAPKTAERLNEGGDGSQPARWSGSLRIFENDWLESQSHIPWWLVLVVWVPVVIALFATGAVAFAQSAGQSLLLGLLGVFLWTFVEYALHRFAFHYVPRSATGRRLHFLAHGIHHLDPWDGTRLVFPPLAGAGVAAVLFGLLVVAVGLERAFPTMAGLLSGYIVYDMTHYYTHHARPKTRWGKFLRAYHLAHHHKHWNAMYGVSSPLWDVILRTGRPRDPAR